MQQLRKSSALACSPARANLFANTRRAVQCRSSGVQFNSAFLAQLQESLQRQESEVAEQIGVPGLTIRQSTAALANEESSEGCNTGTVVWSAGVRLASHLVKNRRDLLKGARVLELGSGTGVVGLTCAAMGAHVILTDQESILQITYDNMQSNLELVEAAGGSAQVAPLDWNNPDDEVFEIPYDWVLGSDVTYEIESMPSLAACLARLVEANPDAVIKLAHRHRNKDLDKGMREIFGAFGLVLRPVDVRTTGSNDYTDPIKVDKSIVFFRVFKQ